MSSQGAIPTSTLVVPLGADAGAACIIIKIGWLVIYELWLSNDLMVGATGFEPATSTPPV